MGRRRLSVIVVDAQDLVRTSWPAIGEVLFLVLMLAFYDRKEYLTKICKRRSLGTDICHS